MESASRVVQSVVEVEGRPFHNEGSSHDNSKYVEVDDLIQTSSTQELCGRRPWNNVENNQKKFPDGNPQGTALQTVRGKHDAIFSMG